MSLTVYRHHLDEMNPPYCARGARRWFARMELDWAAFVRDGISAEALEATGDAMALKLAQHARDQEAQHGGQ